MDSTHGGQFTWTVAGTTDEKLFLLYFVVRFESPAVQLVPWNPVRVQKIGGYTDVRTELHAHPLMTTFMSLGP